MDEDFSAAALYLAMVGPTDDATEDPGSAAGDVGDAEQQTTSPASTTAPAAAAAARPRKKRTAAEKAKALKRAFKAATALNDRLKQQIMAMEHQTADLKEQLLMYTSGAPPSSDVKGGVAEEPSPPPADSNNSEERSRLKEHAAQLESALRAAQSSVLKLTEQNEDLKMQVQLLNSDRAVLHQELADVRASVAALSQSAAVPQQSDHMTNPDGKEDAAGPGAVQVPAADQDNAIYIPPKYRQSSPQASDASGGGSGGSATHDEQKTSASAPQDPQPAASANTSVPETEDAAAAGSSSGAVTVVIRAPRETATEDCWENERFLPLWGWTAPTLPTDRHHFTDITGAQQRRLGDVTLPKGGWEWASNWKIDYERDTCGSDGWEYSGDFSDKLFGWHPQRTMWDAVRRRRWVRKRERRIVR